MEHKLTTEEIVDHISQLVATEQGVYYYVEYVPTKLDVSVRVLFDSWGVLPPNALGLIAKSEAILDVSHVPLDSTLLDYVAGSPQYIEGAWVQIQILLRDREHESVIGRLHIWMHGVLA